MPSVTFTGFSKIGSVSGHRYMYHYTDSSGMSHSIGPVRIAPGTDPYTDGKAREQSLLSELAAAEYEYIAAQFLAGNDMLRDSNGNPINPIYNDRTTLIKRILTAFLSSPDQGRFMKAARFVNNLTDQDLKLILNTSQQTVDAIRARASYLASVNQVISGFSPIVV